MKNKKYRIIGTNKNLKSNQKNRRNRDKMCTHNTHIHDRSLSWFGTDTLIYKVAGLSQFFGPKPPSRRKMMNSIII